MIILILNHDTHFKLDFNLLYHEIYQRCQTIEIFNS